MTADYVKEMNRRFTSDLSEENYADRYRKYFWIGALANVVFTWIEGGMKQSPEEMAAFCESCPIHPKC